MKKLLMYIVFVLFIFVGFVVADPGGPQNDRRDRPANEPAVLYNDDSCFISISYFK